MCQSPALPTPMYMTFPYNIPDLSYLFTIQHPINLAITTVLRLNPISMLRKIGEKRRPIPVS